MNLIILIFFFIFGTIIGSFLNVVILRYNTGKSLNGRSGCFSCGKILKWYELIPIFSFIIQKGKCSACKTRLSKQYPIVEFLTGILFLISGYIIFPLIYDSLFTWMLYGIIYMGISAILIVIATYDLRHKIIPDKFLIIFLILSISHIILITGYNHWIFIWQYFLAGPLVSLPLALLWFVSKGKWMGFGDVKFSLGIGWLLGITLGYSALLLSFWVGAFISIIILFASHLKNLRFGGIKLTIKSEIPFGPFLVFGTLVFLFFPFDLIKALFLF